MLEDCWLIPILNNLLYTNFINLSSIMEFHVRFFIMIRDKYIGCYCNFRSLNENYCVKYILLLPCYCSNVVLSLSFGGLVYSSGIINSVVRKDNYQLNTSFILYKNVLYLPEYRTKML